MTSFTHAKVVILTRPRGATVVPKAAMAAVDDASVVVETALTGISLGTEMKLYRGLSIDKGHEVWYPLVPGYESVGTVVHVGPKVQAREGYLPKIGDRVMANEIRHFPDYCAAWGGQTGLSIKNAQTAGGAGDALAKIPDGVSFEQAICAYLPAVALKGLKRLQPKDGETILVTGCGQVGLAAIQLCKILANCRVIAVDTVSNRAERARPFADAVVDASRVDPVKAVLELTNGRGVDAIDECSGNPDIINTLRNYLKGGGWVDDAPPGRIHLQGDYPRPIILTPYQNWFVTNATITMTCALGPGHKDAILALIAAGRFKTAWGPVYDIDDAPRAYAETDANYFDVVKPILRWK
ncbi:MAG: zinc-binding dehydrogenase [Lentisphaeria bacterium]